MSVVVFLIKALNIQLKKIKTYTTWFVELQDRVNQVMQTMHELDDKQMFSKDDEVGAVFQQMLELIDTLDKKITRD